MDALFANPFAVSDGRVRSLNRALVAALPEPLAAANLLGRRAKDLLSTQALREMILAAGNPLGLDPADPDLPITFDRCLSQPETAPIALPIAAAFGRRLGCLLVMLHLGEPANRAARPEWTGAHWAYWAAARRVVVGGGLMSGELGAIAVEAARQTLAAVGITDLHLERSAFGRRLPLVGLARCAPPAATQALLFDFGETSVKRGLARYSGLSVAGLEALPVAPTPCDSRAGDFTTDAAALRWRTMRELMAETWYALIAPAEVATTAILLCIASHLQDGHPLPTDVGCYGSLKALAPHLETFMRDEMREATGGLLSLTLMHDGAAAAAAYDDAPGTIVVVLGTALGVGYAPGRAVSRPLGEVVVRG